MHTQHKAGTLEALAQVIAERVKGTQRAKPALRLVGPAPPARFDGVTRESILRRIRWLCRTYGIDFIRDQATFNMPGIDALDDDGLSALLRDLERARECIQEGICLDEAGFVRSTHIPGREEYGQ